MRGSGRTTRQIASLPDGAIFVWVGYETRYARKIAEELGKKIRVEPRSWIMSHNWRGVDLPFVEVDHALEPTPSERDNLLSIAHRLLARRKQ